MTDQLDIFTTTEAAGVVPAAIPAPVALLASLGTAGIATILRRHLATCPRCRAGGMAHTARPCPTALDLRTAAGIPA